MFLAEQRAYFNISHIVHTITFILDLRRKKNTMPIYFPLFTLETNIRTTNEYIFGTHIHI